MPDVYRIMLYDSGQAVTHGLIVAEHSKQLSDGLDAIGWQLVHPKPVDGKVGRYEAAPITPLSAKITYHATLVERRDKILTEGLIPSNEAIRHSDHPGGDGKIHVCEALEGDFSVSRWVGIFCRDYNRKPEVYCILKINLEGFQARIYQDIRSQRGIVVDKFAVIPPGRIELVRLGKAEDLLAQ